MTTDTTLLASAALVLWLDAEGHYAPLADALATGEFEFGYPVVSFRGSYLPEYRLSKFQRVLPERWQVEMVGGYLLDFEGTRSWLDPRRGSCA